MPETEGGSSENITAFMIANLRPKRAGAAIKFFKNTR